MSQPMRYRLIFIVFLILFSSCSKKQNNNVYQETYHWLKVLGVNRWGKPYTISEIENITSLNLSNTSLKEFHKIKPLKSLKYLYLDGTNISKNDLHHLSNLPHLTWLYLTNTAIGDEGLEAIKGIATIEVLGLNGTKVSNRGLSYLKELKRLKQLYIAGTEVSDQGLLYLHGIKSLRKVYLTRKISEASLTPQKEPNKSDQFEYNKLQITDYGIGQLQKALPNTVIIY